MKYSVYLALIIVLCIFSNRTPAEDRRWSLMYSLARQANGDSYRACAVGPLHFLVDENKLFTSNDSGAHWRHAASFLITKPVTVFCSPKLIVAGNWTEFAASFDQGNSWRTLSGIETHQGKIPHLPSIASCGGQLYVGLSFSSTALDGTVALFKLVNSRIWQKQRYTRQTAFPPHLTCLDDSHLAIGYDRGLDIIGLADDAESSAPTSLNDGLTLECPEREFGCFSAPTAPLIAHGGSIFLVSAPKVFRLRQNKTGWDRVPNSSESFYPTHEIIRCRSLAFLQGLALYEILKGPPGKLETSIAIPPAKDTAFYWTDGDALFAVTRAGDIYSRTCE